MTNAISRTAYYTLGVRAWDASQPKPLCGDTFAASFMNTEAADIWQQFKECHRPNASNAMRHAIIDAHLREELQADPRARVIVIGAGFDTRAFRLPGGQWLEIDEPAIIDYKNARLPAAKAPNRLTRIAVDFARESLAEKLAPFAGSERTHIVIEGVLMYLTHAERRELLRTLKRAFPRHVVYCDLMRKSFFESYSREVHEKIVGIGAHFNDMIERPETLFGEAGYTPLASASVPLRAAEQRAMGIPAFAVRWFLRKLRTGYCIWKWEMTKA